MPGTGGGYANSENAGVPSLPAPKVQTYHPVGAADPVISNGSPSSGAVIKVPTVRYVKVTVPGIPEAILQDLTKYKPLIELLRYNTYYGKRDPVTNRRLVESGYVHPSHGPAPSGNGSFTHGGAQGGVSGDVLAARETEWPVISGNTAVDVTRGMCAFMAKIPVWWRDSTGGGNIIELPVPTSSRTRKPIPGARFPYSTFKPGYFAFRLSIIDPTDERGKRIHGPMSERVSLTLDEFPFRPDGLDFAGRAAATLAPLQGLGPMNFWIGASSRLPS